MAEKFRVTWEAHDGYVGGSAPQHFSITDGYFEPDTPEDELRELFDEMVQEDFNQKVSWSSDDQDSFVAWAKERQAKMRAENDNG